MPGDQHIEGILKQDVMRGLARASKDTDKGEYHKTRHGFAILERIDPTLVCARSPHAKAFFSFLLSQLS